MAFKNLEPEFWSGKDIIEKYQKKELWIPRYQRSFVWNDDKQKKFMESLSKGWPVGTILVHKKDEKLFIMDGLQRTSTLVKYSQHWETHPAINNKEFLTKIKENHIAENGKSYIDDIMSIVRNLFPEIVQFYNTEYFDNNNYFNVVPKQERLSQLWDKVFGPWVNDFKDSLIKFLSHFDEAIIQSVPKIDEYKVLVQIWQGLEEDAPEIFQRINSEGEKLLPEIVIASGWKKYNQINWESKDFKDKFKEINSKRFASLFDLEVITKTQIEGSAEKSFFGALEIIYYIAHEISENIKDDYFKKILYVKPKGKKQNRKSEFNLKIIIILINTYLTYFKEMIEPSSMEKFDLIVDKYLFSETNIESAITNISYHINTFIDIIKFTIMHENEKNYDKIIRDKGMFWTTLFALNLRNRSYSKSNKVYKFLIKNFVATSALVQSSDDFSKIKGKVTKNSFADDSGFGSFENDQKEFFEKEKFKKGKKTPTLSTHWERTLIIKILYLEFLHKGEDLESLAFLQYIGDGDFKKGHQDLRNYNFYSNYAFFPKGGFQAADLSKDYLLNPSKNEWLHKNWEKKGKKFVNDIKNHLLKFDQYKNLNKQLEMNKQLLHFLEKRKTLIVQTLKYYLK